MTCFSRFLTDEEIIIPFYFVMKKDKESLKLLSLMIIV